MEAKSTGPEPESLFSSITMMKKAGFTQEELVQLRLFAIEAALFELGPYVAKTVEEQVKSLSKTRKTSRGSNANTVHKLS
jgi:hypothetical protein